MKVYRLARKKYKIELSGRGAALSGNRWNSKGTEIIYCAESRALAVAEIVVHLSLATMPKDFVMLEINIPSTVLTTTLRKTKLSVGWDSFPHTLHTQLVGDEFVRAGKYGVIKVPSAVVQGDFNYLINPSHPDFSKIRIITQSDFPLDQRLLN